MDSAITVSLEAIKMIAVLIASLRNTHKAISNIETQTKQLSNMLETLHRKSQTHIFTQADINMFLSHQNTCNEILGRIHEILDGYARKSEARHRLFDMLVFQFGEKGELKGLVRNLDISVKYFSRDLRTVLIDAPLKDRPLPNMPRSSAAKKPAMNLSQYVQMKKAEWEESDMSAM